MSRHDSDELEDGIERSIGEEDCERLMTTLEITKRRRRKTMLYIIVASVAILALAILVLVLGVSIGISNRPHKAITLPSDPYERADALLADFPLIDG